MAGRINKGYFIAALALDLVGANMLGDAPSFTVNQVSLLKRRVMMFYHDPRDP